MWPERKSTLLSGSSRKCFVRFRIQVLLDFIWSVCKTTNIIFYDPWGFVHEIMSSCKEPWPYYKERHKWRNYLNFIDFVQWSWWCQPSIHQNSLLSFMIVDVYRHHDFVININIYCLRIRFPFPPPPIIDNKMLHGRNFQFVLKFSIKTKHILSYYSSPVFLQDTAWPNGYKCMSGV